MKNKLLILLITFLLLVPFRLPISILFVRFFKWLLNETTSIALPPDVYSTNITITKTVYNIALSSVFIYNVEMFSRQKFGRMATQYDDDFPIYWWVIPIGILLVSFIVMDAINVNQIFFVEQGTGR